MTRRREHDEEASGKLELNMDLKEISLNAKKKKDFAIFFNQLERLIGCVT